MGYIFVTLFIVMAGYYSIFKHDMMAAMVAAQLAFSALILQRVENRNANEQETEKQETNEQQCCGMEACCCGMECCDAAGCKNHEE